MEKIRRAYWIGAGTAALYSISGFVISATVGFAPGLVVACLFSLIGAAIAVHGARREDMAWWGAGVLITGFITPTVWGIVPMVVSLLAVLIVSWMHWRSGRIRPRQD